MSPEEVVSVFAFALDAHRRVRGTRSADEDEARQLSEDFPKDVDRLVALSGCQDRVALAWLWTDAGEDGSCANWLDMCDDEFVLREVEEAACFWEKL